MQELQKQVARLEAENLRLKLQLKVGEESEAQERQEKERITKKLDEMVRSPRVRWVLLVMVMQARRPIRIVTNTTPPPTGEERRERSGHLADD